MISAVVETRTAAPSVPRVQIGQTTVDCRSFEDAENEIIAAVKRGGRSQYVVTPNAQGIVLAATEPRLRRLFADAAFVLPDGVSLLIGARILGKKFPERVPGVDMFQALCRRAAKEGLRVFLLGGLPGSAEKAVAKLQELNPGLIVAGVLCPPLGFEKDLNQVLEIRRQINAARPDLLFVAFGTPKQEYWMDENLPHLDVPMSMAVGGSFEMVGGIVPRAPKWVQSLGAEWLYRLSREPRRLWKRYLVGNTQFLSIVLRQRLTR